MENVKILKNDRIKRVGRPPSKVKKEQYSVRLPPDLIAKIDLLAIRNNRSRSDELTHILTGHISENFNVDDNSENYMDV